MGSGSTKQWEKGKMVQVLKEQEGSINCVAISSNGTFLVTGSDDATAKIWSTKTKFVECIGVLKGHDDYITCCVVVDTDIITASADGTIRKWCMTKCVCTRVYKGHESQVNRIICTGEFIFSTSYDTTAKAWIFNIDQNYPTRIVKSCIKTFSGHEKSVLPIIFIPASGAPSRFYEGRVNINPSDLIITGSADCTIRAWAFDSGVTVRIFEGHTEPITSMVTDPKGHTLFSSSIDSTIRSWSIKSGAALTEFKGHQGPIISIQLINQLLYSASTDSSVRCWVPDLGHCTREFKGHQHSVTCFTIYNKILFTGSADTLVRAFNVNSGELAKILRGHKAVITAILVVNDRLFTSSTDGILRVWDISQLENEILIETSLQKQIGIKPLSHHSTRRPIS